MRLGLGLRGRFEQATRELGYLLKNARKPHLFDLSTSERVGCVYREPTDMCPTDRIMLYALVRGLRPERAIEIGTRWGNSARIITNAMEDNGCGKLVGIDPITNAFRAKRRETHDRFELIEGYSPAAIPRAIERLGGPVDLAFVDGLHIYDAVKADFTGLLPHLADGAHVLFHDTYHQGIDQAIREVVRDSPSLFDCGFITRNASLSVPVAGQGLRLIRKGVVDGRDLIKAAYERSGQDAPTFAKDLWNYDDYYNSIKARS